MTDFISRCKLAKEAQFPSFATALLGFNDLGCSVTPSFLFTNSSSFNGKIFRKKSMLENFRANVLKRSTMQFIYLHHIILVTELYSTLLFPSLLYSTLLFSTLLYSTLLYTPVRSCTLLCCTLLYSTLLYSALLCSALLYSTLL